MKVMIPHPKTGEYVEAKFIYWPPDRSVGIFNEWYEDIDIEGMTDDEINDNIVYLEAEIEKAIDDEVRNDSW